MKRINKPTYYFEEKDKKAFCVWCINNNSTQREVAKRLSITETHLSLVLNGKRPVTKQLIAGLAKLGFKEVLKKQ